MHQYLQKEREAVPQIVTMWAVGMSRMRDQKETKRVRDVTFMTPQAQTKYQGSGQHKEEARQEEE
jgi:hypothetical protein